jgi:hypothetical protein
MLRTLLICGLIAGACAGVVGFGFASIAGEGSVDAAIAFEEMKAAEAGVVEEGESAVTRDAQKGIGLLTATVVYGVAFGGIFALVFAAVYGRVANVSPARTAVWLAGIAFMVVFLIPFLKYPSTPPATGDTETIDKRTLLYLTMIVVSILSAVAAVRIREWVRRNENRRQYGLVAAVAGYLAIVLIAMAILPAVNEIPADFPATSLYTFRLSTIGLQLAMWTTIGLVFAFFAQRKMAQAADSAGNAIPAGVERA